MELNTGLSCQEDILKWMCLSWHVRSESFGGSEGVLVLIVFQAIFHFKSPVLAVTGCDSLSELDDFTASPTSFFTVFFAVA